MEGEEQQLVYQQVMGPDANLSTKTIVPKFRYDGGNPTMFKRDFLPHVAKAYGVADVFAWEEDKVLTAEEELRDNTAFLVLRQYLTDRVLKIVMVGQPKRASSVFNVLSAVFLTNDARTSLQVGRELSMCEMA